MHNAAWQAYKPLSVNIASYRKFMERQAEVASGGVAGNSGGSFLLSIEIQTNSIWRLSPSLPDKVQISSQNKSNDR